jgi:hypothetical protein
MGSEFEVYCSTCFALPGELCRTKFIIYAADEVMPVVCPTHHSRLVASRREALRNSFAKQLLAAARVTFRNK